MYCISVSRGYCFSVEFVSSLYIPFVCSYTLGTSWGSVFFPLQSTVAKRCGGVGCLVKYVGADAVDTMAPMEKRELYPTLGAIKEVESIMCCEKL